MLKYNKRPFDIRVMVQKNERGVWEHTGTIGRVAHPKRIVTNYHNGGIPFSLSTLLHRRLSSKEIAKLHRQLAELGVSVASRIGKELPRVKEVGIDIGLDREYKPWIFEVNTRPDPLIFAKLGNPRLFRRMLRLTPKHGRFRHLKLGKGIL